MTESRLITISHFSDVLCIWAYIAQIRIDELKTQFGSNVELQYHFFPVFGSVDTMIDKNWSKRGGIAAYNKHVLSIAAKFEHIEVNPDIWLKNRPTTSVSCHLFFKALQLLEAQNKIGLSVGTNENRTLVENFIFATRLAFFKDLQDISNFDVLMGIAEKMNLPVAEIQEKIKTGEAYAALDLDLQLKDSYQIAGSPTLVFNEGRQIIYGNVGYRVIEANIRELIRQPERQASWC